MVKRRVFCRRWMISLVLVVWSTGAFREASAQSVVVYSALDQEFAEPVLKAYATGNGVRVLPKFDVESTKTVHAMEIDFEAAAKLWDKAAAFLVSEFGG